MQTSIIYPHPLCSLTCPPFTPSVFLRWHWRLLGIRREEEEITRESAWISPLPCTQVSSFPRSQSLPQPHSRGPLPALLQQVDTWLRLPWPQPNLQCPALMADSRAMQLTVWSLGWQPGCSTSHYFSHCSSFPCDWRQLGCQAQPWLTVT